MVCDAGVRINVLIDAALEAEHRSKPPRNYLGGSRIREPCARRLAYEVTLTPVDAGKDFDGARLRIFDAGHQFEDLTIHWLQAAGFDLRTRGRDGRQFGFSTPPFRGHNRPCHADTTRGHTGHTSLSEVSSRRTLSINILTSEG